MNPGGQHQRWRGTDHIVFAAALGLVVGLVEAALWAVRRFGLGEITLLSAHVVWMAPLVYATLLVVLAAVLALADRLLPRGLPPGPGVFVVALPPIAALVLLGPPLHPFALVLLAAGLAYQLQRFVTRSPARWRRAARATAGVLTVVTLAATAAVVSIPALAERNAVAALDEAAEDAPDVLFIILDTVRAASLSLYGYDRPTTPVLEALAAGGAVFDRAISTAPWTLPSHASMFTGRYPHEMGADWLRPMGPEPTTLAEALAARGYRTAGFVANTGYTSRETGLARGFQHYADHRITLGEIVRNASLTRWIDGSFRLRRMLGTDEHLNRQPAPVVTGRFLRWLDRQPEDRPVFAFLNYYDAHGPYLPPASHATRFGPGRAESGISPLHRWNWDVTMGHRPLTPSELREEIDAYDASIAYLDERLGDLFEELERRGRLDRTLIVVTADHGEEFGEHGVYDHGNSLYFAGVHVPLIVRLPGDVPAGLRIAEPVTLRDLPATVLSLVGGGGPSLPGRSLAAHWDSDAATTPASPLLSEVSHASGHPDWFPVSRGDMKAVIVDGMRYIRNGDGGEELYDIGADPWEREDLAGATAWTGTLERSRSMLARWFDADARVGAMTP